MKGFLYFHALFCLGSHLRENDRGGAKGFCFHYNTQGPPLRGAKVALVIC